MKHLDYEVTHNSWLYCFTNPLDPRVPSSRGLVKQYNQELCLSSLPRIRIISRITVLFSLKVNYFNKRPTSRPDATAIPVNFSPGKRKREEPLETDAASPEPTISKFYNRLRALDMNEWPPEWAAREINPAHDIRRIKMY